MDTIFAQATAPGKAGVSIIRVSGPDARALARGLGAELEPTDRKVVSLLGADQTLIDVAFVLAFPEGQSFTGEQVVELHLHGSPAVVRRVQSILAEAGCRPAEPGEFTRRALENGCLDLAQVEGLADLIDAETEEQRRQAVRVLDGALGDLVEGWRRNLVRAAALLEATIDFADEEVPTDVVPEVRALLHAVSEDLSKEVRGAVLRERIREGFEVAIIGPPNIGKSTLFNRLAGRDAAITSEIAGTTRDVIEVSMDLRGLPVTFLDTAGIRESEDTIEALGVTRGLERASTADLRVHLVEAGKDPIVYPDPDDLVVWAKADLLDQEAESAVSGLTGLGVSELIDQIADRLEARVRGAGTATRLRHAAAMGVGHERIVGVLAKLDMIDEQSVDLLAEDLRVAIRSLDSLVGRIDAENLLDEIFSSFCIGK